MSSKGSLIVISGPSGSGKGTVVKALMELMPDLGFSVSATTRSPREGEVDGREYYFVSRESFEKMIEDGDILEYTTYCGNYYGTPLREAEEVLARGQNLILEIEVEGALQVMKKCPGVISIFIVPPSFEELEKRLRSRGTEDGETIEKRLEKAKEEIGCRGRYTYNVINDDLDKAVQEVYDIIHQD